MQVEINSQLDELKRTDLQKLCKSYNLKAGGKVR